MSDLLRQYEPWECGPDGYPHAWHHETQAVDQSNVHPGDGPIVEPAIKHLIREQAQHRCERCWHPYKKGMGEWSPCDESCKHGLPYRVLDGHSGTMVELGTDSFSPEERADAIGRGSRVEAQWRILTVHHLDSDKANCRWWNLVALCQRCHLSLQRRVVMDRPWHFEHSIWFQPYAAAFYAYKYLGEDLAREETMARLGELLALEHRFTQEALL